MGTVINNDNIRNLLESYTTNKSTLPDDLRNIPIGNWNVSQVTDMSYLFEDYYQEFNLSNFNEPLNWDTSNVTNMSGMFSGCQWFNQPLNWDTSNVTDMSEMFSGCRSFNQPLNWDTSSVTNMKSMFSFCQGFNQPLNWDTSNVTNMMGMFSGCRRFNQPLNNWNVSSVTNHGVMFTNCGISEENKPRFVNTIIEVDANQIHRETSKINYEKLNTFLSNILNTTVPSDIYFPDYIYNTIVSFIDESSISEEDKQKQTDDLNKIMDERLGNLNYGEFAKLIRDSIFYILEYVEQQPIEFKEMYATTFIQDCVHAYEGINGMTCAAGALERIVMSVVPACTTDENNENYKTLLGIITANPAVLIADYIKDWYKLHKIGTPDAFPPETSEEDKKNNLRNYLLEKFPNETTLIDNKIAEIADIIGYEDDDFMYGGRKRKTKKLRLYVGRKHKTGGTIKNKKGKKSKKSKKSKKGKKGKKSKKSNR